MAYTAVATKVYKDPVTTVWANSLQGNDEYLYTGVAKAWVVVDGSAADLSAAIRAKQNVTSITDLGTGIGWGITAATVFLSEALYLRIKKAMHL